jgi:isoleucyl-tRNA synthetase
MVAPCLVGWYHSLQVLAEGNMTVIEQLKRSGALMQHKPFTHRYPVDWRTKKPIIQRLI